MPGGEWLVEMDFKAPGDDDVLVWTWFSDQV